MKPWLAVALWFLLLIISEALALYFIKLYALNENQIMYYVLSVALYGLCMWAFSQILIKDYGVAMVNIMWNIASVIYGIFIGVILFKEKISHTQIIGLIFGIVGMCMLAMQDNK
jgi:spermidine export protein MdtJ